MTDATTTVPSLAELRALLATVEPVFSAADRARRGTELEILAHVPALLDIAEAAQALDTALLHDAVAGDAAKLTLDDLDEALAGVRP